MATTSSSTDPGPCTRLAHHFSRGARACNCGGTSRTGECSGWAVRSRLSGVEIRQRIQYAPKLGAVDSTRALPAPVDQAYRLAVRRANRFVLISAIPIVAAVAALYLLGANGVVLTIVPSLVGAMMTAMFAAHLNKTSKLQAENDRLRAQLAEASEHRDWCYYCGNSADDHELDCELSVSDGRDTLST